MRNVLIPLTILLLSVLLVVSCGKKSKDIAEMAVEEAPVADAISDTVEITEMAAMPGADAGELWKFITETSPYEEWAYWPGYEGYQPGKSPHGAILQVFVSEHGIMNIADESKSTMDNGVVIVKENYMPDTTLAALTVMHKVEGFNPEAGDWFWAKYAPDGTVAASGTPAGCIGCHGGVASNDYLFTGDLGLQDTDTQPDEDEDADEDEVEDKDED
ncbi:MAG: cytochrome P460 family protein [Thermodesulfobacteriota bacterium]